jgi:DNA helicase-2/ATP-dependent DNA helicase PcrA
MPLTLTDEQEAIVYAPVGHYVVSAVAGSGKTTTLAYRIRHLLQQGFSGKRILILMFNRSAREDFQRKLTEVLATTSSTDQAFIIPDVRTFHALAYRLYQRFVQEGYLAPFKTNILSDKEQDYQIWRLLSQLLSADQAQELKRYKKEHIEMCRRFIENVKSGLQDAQQVFEALDLDKKFAYLPELFTQFEAWRKQEARISYSDMLYDTVHAIQRHPQLKQLVANKMDIVLVDEYQDTNDIQHALLKYIAGDRARITVVGDPDQTIYEFRGAKPDYIIKGFSEEFADASLLTLSYSFRYGHGVSLLANHLISHNRSRLPVLCKSHHANPQTGIYLHASNDDGQTLVKHLRALELKDLSQSVILARVWSQTVNIELALLEAAIPYHIDGHPGVFHSNEIRAIRALLALAAGQFTAMSNEQRQEKLEQICQFPHIGLPEYQLKQLCQLAGQYPQHIGRQLLQMIPEDLKKFQQLKLERLAKTLESIENKTMPAAQMLQHYVEQTDLYDGIRSLGFNHEQAEEKVISTKGIIAFLSRQGKTAAALLEMLDELARKAEFKHPASIKLTTIHRAKGLEWQHVFIPGLNQLTLPYLPRPEKVSRNELESERRLLYVAMTRAIQNLHLLVPPANAKRDASPFQAELRFSQCAQFAEHLYRQPETEFSLEKAKQPSALLVKYAEIMNCPLKQGNRPAQGQAMHGIDKLTSEPNEPSATSEIPAAQSVSSRIYPGCEVIHCLLGKGMVIEEKNSAFTVAFDNQDKRTFSKDFADRFFTFPESEAS